MNLNDLLNKLPDYAYDVKHNLSEVLNHETTPGMSKEEIAAVALAISLTTSSKLLISHMERFARQSLSEKEIEGVKTAHAMMSMTNVYYGFIDRVKSSDYDKMPLNLQMRAGRNPKINQKAYEFAALGVSVINNCTDCMSFHESRLRKLNISAEGVQSCIRISAVIFAVGELLKFEE